jgi:hypothetical protein
MWGNGKAHKLNLSRPEMHLNPYIRGLVRVCGMKRVATFEGETKMNLMHPYSNLLRSYSVFRMWK